MAGGKGWQLKASKGSRLALLVAGFSRRWGGVEVEVELVEDQGKQATLTCLCSPPCDGVAATTIAGEFSVAKRLAAAATLEVATMLLGATDLQRADVEQWLAVVSTSLTSSPSSSSSTSSSSSSLSSSSSSAAMAQRGLARLQLLNAQLSSRSVLTSDDTGVSLADMATLVAIQDDVMCLSLSDRSSLPHLMRWINYVQSVADVDGVLPHIAVDPAPFAPPSIPVKEEQKAAATAKGGAVAAAGQSGGTAAQPAKQADAAKEAAKQEDQQKGKGEKEKAGKGDKKAAASAAADAAAAANPAAVGPDISALDIRVGHVTKAWKHPAADTLLVEDIDMGEGTTRQVVSGLAAFLTPEQLQGRRVVVLLNVKPGKVRDVMSSGLVLCASNDDKSKCEPLQPPEAAAVGERVTFAGYEGKPEEVLNPKKKLFEKLQPDLKTDASGVATYRGVAFMTTAGPCTSKITNAAVK